MQDDCNVQVVAPEPECARTEHVTGSAGFLTKGSCGSGPGHLLLYLAPPLGTLRFLFLAQLVSCDGEGMRMTLAVAYCRK